MRWKNITHTVGGCRSKGSRIKVKANAKFRHLLRSILYILFSRLHFLFHLTPMPAFYTAPWLLFQLPLLSRWFCQVQVMWSYSRQTWLYRLASGSSLLLQSAASFPTFAIGKTGAIQGEVTFAGQFWFMLSASRLDKAEIAEILWREHG